MQEVAQSDTLLTLAEAALRTRFSAKTLRRAIESGELVAFKVRGRWRIRDEALEAWIGSRRYVPAGESVELPTPACPPEVGSLLALRRIEAA